MSLVAVKPTIAELRELIGTTQISSKPRSLFSLYPDGFSLGSLVEISGPGKTELISQFLVEHPSFKVAWVESKITINPYGLFQKGVELKNILFIESGDEDLWCLTQVLQSGCFQVLVSSELKFEEKELRRFQLMSEKGAMHFFILSEKLHQSWVPQLQLEVARTKLDQKDLTESDQKPDQKPDQKSELQINIQRKRGLG